MAAFLVDMREPPDKLSRCFMSIELCFSPGGRFYLADADTQELPLAEAARAHREVMEPGSSGKIVLVP